MVIYSSGNSLPFSSPMTLCPMVSGRNFPPVRSFTDTWAVSSSVCQPVGIAQPDGHSRNLWIGRIVVHGARVRVVVYIWLMRSTITAAAPYLAAAALPATIPDGITIGLEGADKKLD